MSVTTEAIWKEFNHRLLGFLRVRLSNAAEAEDVLQEVFLKVHTRIDTLRDRARLAPWLYRIARNTLIDHERRRRPWAPLPEDLADDTGSPDGDAERRIASSLRAMVEGLPEGYRQAVWLYEIEGLKHEQIAARMGLSLSGAKSRVQRGRRMLKEALLECCHFEFDRLGHIIDYSERQACCPRCFSNGCDACGA